MGDFTWIWLIVLVISVILEAATLSLVSIWFAGGALTALLANLLHLPIWIQVVLFLLESLVLLLLTRPLAMRYFNRDRTRTNVDSFIGQEGIVLERVVNLQAKGKVMLNGMEWSARSHREDEEIAEGTVVEVAAVSGAKLIVLPKT